MIAVDLILIVFRNNDKLLLLKSILSFTEIVFTFVLSQTKLSMSSQSLSLSMSLSESQELDPENQSNLLRSEENWSIATLVEKKKPESQNVELKKSKEGQIKIVSRYDSFAALRMPDDKVLDDVFESIQNDENNLFFGSQSTDVGVFTSTQLSTNLTGDDILTSTQVGEDQLADQVIVIIIIMINHLFDTICRVFGN